MDKESSPVAKARASALRLLRVRLRSVAELRDRLQRKGFPSPVIEEVLAFLEGLGYLDDLSFARTWVQCRMNSRPRSRGVLARELRHKGVAEDVILQALDMINDDIEWQGCCTLARRRWPQTAGLPIDRRRARVAAFLQRRGFRTALILKVLREMTAHEEC